VQCHVAKDIDMDGSVVENYRSIFISLVSNIRSIGIVARATCFWLGVGLICRIPCTHAHNRPYKLALIPTRPSRCTQNSGPHVYFRRLRLFSLSRFAARIVMRFPPIFLTTECCSIEFSYFTLTFQSNFQSLTIARLS